MQCNLVAGAAMVDISPKKSLFLYGYPHVKRDSTGVHDPLLASALYLSDGRQSVIFVANDIIFITKSMADRIRPRIAEATGVPGSHIMLSATHTHSGPVTVKHVCSENDPIVPNPDPEYLQQLEENMVKAAVTAYRNRQGAKVGLAMADGTGIGTNRHDPKGPFDPQVPVLAVKSVANDSFIAAMIVFSMHPTVLHEDSTLVSGDFPGMTRIYLQKKVLGEGVPVLYHTGPAGDQSPRHVTRANTFAEAERLGNMLGERVAAAMREVQYDGSLSVDARQQYTDLPRREFPPVEMAEKELQRSVARLEHLRATHSPRTEIRTAECDWFGAEETLTLSRAARNGQLRKAMDESLPAEVQVLRVGKWKFVAWPGECFVEFSLAVKRELPDTFVISLANGEFQGYLVTEQAVREGWYEAGNSALKNPDAGNHMVRTTLSLLRQME